MLARVWRLMALDGTLAASRSRTAASARATVSYTATLALQSFLLLLSEGGCAGPEGQRVGPASVRVITGSCLRSTTRSR
jgi:hypothetical protein